MTLLILLIAVFILTYPDSDVYNHPAEKMSPGKRPFDFLFPIYYNCIYDGMSAKSYNMDIEPDDIDVSDTVTVIWEIA